MVWDLLYQVVSGETNWHEAVENPLTPGCSARVTHLYPGETGGDQDA